MSASGSQKSAVYTVLLGGYESINDAQNIGDHSTDFICFTDDPGLTSSVWQIRATTPLFARDLQRSQREFKIRGCAELDVYDRTLYIDNSVSLTASPEQILDSWLADSDLALALHSFRATVLDEFLAVVEAGLDEPARVYEQLYHYSEIHPAVLDQRPLWGGMIARRNIPEVRSAMNRWFEEVLRYSRRDQLSVNHILGEANIRLNRVEIDNLASDIHQWPVQVGRIHPVKRRTQTRSIPDLARIRELESQLADEIDRSLVKDGEIELRDRRIAEIQATRSWLLAQRISTIASFFRINRDNRRRQKTSA